MKVWVGVTGLRKGKLQKRKVKEMANSIVVELVTSQFKEFNNSNSYMSQMFKDLITVVSEKATVVKEIVRVKDEERVHKLMLNEQKLKAHGG